MDVNNIVSRLVRKYSTRNPFELAEGLGIKVLYEELGDINGYYNKPLRMKQIHINWNLDDPMKRFTCAHELGHAIIHPDVNTPFLRRHTGLNINKYEIEANKFAACLLIPDEVILENCYLTTDQLSRLFGYGKSIIELRQDMYREIL